MRSPKRNKTAAAAAAAASAVQTGLLSAECLQARGFGEDSSSELPSITDTQTDGEESDRVGRSGKEGWMREKKGAKEELLLSKGRTAQPTWFA